MQVATFSARSPYEIGDKIQVLTPAGKNQGGALYMTAYATITDIACTHYLKTGKVIFSCEIDGSGKYERIMTLKEVGLTV